MNEHTATETPTATAPPTPPATEVIPVDDRAQTGAPTTHPGEPTAQAGQPAYGQRPQADLQQVEGAKPRPTSRSCCPATTRARTSCRRSTASPRRWTPASSPTSCSASTTRAPTTPSTCSRHAPARYPHLRILPFRRNGGSGTARRIGTQQARGEIVVWTDADMTYENERIPELVRILRDDADLRPGRRRPHHRGGHPQVGPGAGEVAHPQDRRVADQARRSPTSTPGCARSAATCRLPYLRLLPAGFSCVTTITIAFLSATSTTSSTSPTSYAKRAGVSKFHFVNDAYRYILQVLRMVMYFDPLKVLMPPALWMIVIGLVKARRRHGPAPVLLPGEHGAAHRQRHHDRHAWRCSPTSW